MFGPLVAPWDLETTWVDLGGDKQIDPGPDCSAPFRPSGAHGGPREPRERFLFEKSAPETKSKAHSLAICDFGPRQKTKIKITD